MLTTLRAFRCGAVNNLGRALSTSTRTWNVFLAGEIHTEWREKITEEAAKAGVPVVFESPNVVHADSDDAGIMIQV